MKNIFSLMLILIFAAVLYFYKLDNIPNGFYVDEATVSYNAFSIGETGKDEYGFSYPIYFRLMGSYSPSVYIYLSSIFIKIFGYLPIVTRSISALAMIFSVLFFYLLIKNLKIFKKNILYLILTFFYSILPAIVFNARLGYETTLGYLIFNIGVYFLYCALEKQKYLMLGILFLSFSTYISHNQRFLAPLYLIIYLVFFNKNLFKKQNKSILINSFVVGFVTQIPNLLMITTPAFWIKNGQFGFKYFWNFLTYLSPKTLFFQNPDIDLQHTIPKVSLLFDWMVIPYFIGLYLLFRKLKEQKYKFIIFYAIIVLIPAIFSGYFYSSQRSLVFIVPLMIIIGMGIDQIIVNMNKKIVFIILSLISTYSLIMLYSSYFVLFPKERANAWGYGYDQVADFISKNPKLKFMVDDTRNPRLYSILLYYLKVPPKEYQNEVSPIYRDNYYQAYIPASIYTFENVVVREINWENDPRQDFVIIGDNLSVSESQAKEHNLKEIKEIKDPLGNVIFKMYKTKFK